MRPMPKTRNPDPFASPPSPEDVQPAEALAQAFRHALEQIGGAEGLAHWARRNEGAFFALLARRSPAAEVGDETYDESEWAPLPPPLTKKEWLQEVQAWRETSGDLAPQAQPSDAETLIAPMQPRRSPEW